MAGSLMARIVLKWGLLAALATLGALLLFGGSGTPVSAQAVGGPVVLMGIDAEDGGVGGHGPISVYDDVVNSILGDVANGGSGILVIGGGKDAKDDVTTFWDQIGSDTGAAITYVNGAANISSQSFAGFAMLAVISSEEETSDGGLTQAENDALAARIGAIASFVNGGGGLLGFTQSGFTNPYDYIGGIGGFTVNINLGYEEIAPTAEGLAIGITDDLDICCWHDIYLTFPSFLTVLAIHDESGGEGFGEPAAIGGAEVVILPEGPFGNPTCSDGIDNDADGLVDGDDPDCAAPTATPGPATPAPTSEVLPTVQPPAPTATAQVASLPTTGAGSPGGTDSSWLLLAVVAGGFAAVASGLLVYRLRYGRAD